MPPNTFDGSHIGKHRKLDSNVVEQQQSGEMSRIKADATFGTVGFLPQ